MAFKDFLRALTLRTAFLITINIVYNCITPFFSIYLQWLGLNVLQMGFIRAVQTWTSTLMIPAGKQIMKKMWRSQCKKCLIVFSILVAVVCYLCMIVLSQHNISQEYVHGELERLQFKESNGFLLPNIKKTLKYENYKRNSSKISTTTSLPMTPSIKKPKSDLKVNSNHLTKSYDYYNFSDQQSDLKDVPQSGNKNLEFKEVPKSGHKISISDIFSDKLYYQENLDKPLSNQSASSKNLSTVYKNHIKNEEKPKPSPRFEEVTLKPDFSGDFRTVNIINQLRPLQNSYEFKEVTLQASKNKNVKEDSNKDGYEEEYNGGDGNDEDYKVYKDSGKQDVDSFTPEFDIYDSITSISSIGIIDRNDLRGLYQNKNHFHRQKPDSQEVHTFDDSDKTNKVKSLNFMTPNTFVNGFSHTRSDTFNNQRETQIINAHSKSKNSNYETSLESKNMDSYLKYMQKYNLLSRRNNKQHNFLEDSMVSTTNGEEVDDNKYKQNEGNSYRNINEMFSPNKHISNTARSSKHKSKKIITDLRDVFKPDNVWNQEKGNKFSSDSVRDYEYVHDFHKRRLLAIFEDKDFDVSRVFKLHVLSLSHENAAYLSKVILVFVLGVLSETIVTLLVPCVTTLWGVSQRDIDFYHIKLWKIISWGIITCPALAATTITTYKLPELLPHLWLAIICLMVTVLLVFCIPAPKCNSKYENLDILFQTDITITTFAARSQSRYVMPVLGLMAGAMTACNSEFMFWHMLSRSKNLISFEIASYLYIIITTLVKAPIYWCLRYRGMLKQSNTDILSDIDSGSYVKNELYRVAVLFPLGHFFLGLQLIIMCFTSSNLTVIYLAILCGSSAVMLKCVKCKHWYSWGYGLGCLGGGILSWLKNIPYLFFISGFGSLVWSVIIFLFVCLPAYRRNRSRSYDHLPLIEEKPERGDCNAESNFENEDWLERAIEEEERRNSLYVAQ